MSIRKRMMQDIDRDIADHIAMETQDNIDRGMSPEEARHAALRKFGNVTRVTEDTRSAWGYVWLEQLWQDLRFGVRMFFKSPGFTAVAVLTLALGIGANTAIFSLIDAVMLRALPVHDPSQLVLLKWRARHEPNIHGMMSSGDCPMSMGPRLGLDTAGCAFSEPMFRQIEKAKVFSSVAAFANANRLTVTGRGPATVINGQLVSGDFFRTMGLKTAAGRLIIPADDSPSASPVAVLNYAYWQSAFGGSAEIIGSVIELNNVAYTVVGVAEPRFTGITPGSDYDIWLPLSNSSRVTMLFNLDQKDVAFWWLTIVGRIKEGTPSAQAQAVVNGMFRNEMLHGAVPAFRDGPQPTPVQKNVPTPKSIAAPAASPPGGAIRAPMTLSRAIPSHPPGAGQTNKPLDEPAPSAPAPALGRRTSFSEADNPEVSLLPAQTGLIGSRSQYSNPLYTLMLAVGIVLLIACANVAGLMLARASARQKETAVRLAVGAARMRIIRQLLTESILLSGCGGFLGVIFAYWGVRLIVSFVSSNQARPLGFVTGVDLRILAFTLVVSVFTGILFGLAPAFRSVRLNLTPALKEGDGTSSTAGSHSHRWFVGRWLATKWVGAGSALVVAQVALAIVVLVGAGLLVRTLANLRAIDLGFDSHNILMFRINPSFSGYKNDQFPALHQDIQQRLAAIPGVKSVSFSAGPLVSGGVGIRSFHWPGTAEKQTSFADTMDIGPTFFETMQIPLITGRNFAPADFSIAVVSFAAMDARQDPHPGTAPIPVIVNQAFVEKYCPRENPLGKHFGQGPGDADSPASAGFEIIGVVRDTKYGDLRREINPMLYSPHTNGMASYELRTALEPGAIMPAVRTAVADVNPNLPLFDVQTQSEQIDRLLFRERLVARLSGFFAVLALALACIGLYGLLSYEVSRRTRELGIRIALGAKRESVMALVLRRGIVLAILGAAVGMLASVGVTRYLASMLYNIRPDDPFTIAATAVILTLVAVVACYIPARRATRVDPMEALRYE
jgi:predicted permease